jgi:hypothetical protein
LVRWSKECDSIPEIESGDEIDFNIITSNKTHPSVGKYSHQNLKPNKLTNLTFGNPPQNISFPYLFCYRIPMTV